jgi:uncharacterized protein YutE (UPF0331/DUF86 family)
MKAIDAALLSERSRVLEAHLERLQGALPADVHDFRRGTDGADVVSMHLFFGIQIVLDLAVFACIHFGLHSPASYDEAMAQLAHAGRISDSLGERLEKAANFRDAFVHAFDDVDTASIYRAARAIPDDLRMFMADLAGHLEE